MSLTARVITIIISLFLWNGIERALVGCCSILFLLVPLLNDIIINRKEYDYSLTISLRLFFHLIWLSLCGIRGNNARIYNELESAEELSGKELKKLESYQNGKPTYDAIVETLMANVSTDIYTSPKTFIPVLTGVLAGVTDDKKLIEKIADGLSEMDKTAEIQRDRKGNIIFDKETKDTELVPYEDDIDDYMEREVLPYIPDAVAFFEENMSAKKPVIKTGAEIPFTRNFYKYQSPASSDELSSTFAELEKTVNVQVSELFG